MSVGAIERAGGPCSPAAPAGAGSAVAVVQREVTLLGTLSFLLVLVIALVTHQSGSQSKSRFTLYRVWQLADDCFPSVNQTFIYLV